MNENMGKWDYMDKEIITSKTAEQRIFLIR